ncbi:Aromatic hydrocarbon utilization transcriptional regulator CatR (LysR family) (plasmid) [Cupriavidus necator H850]|nr:Aromatic hydrocarbon utilization transcriptional regulator CatR (LysR family) [Cupriavidus necator H850]
MTRRVGNIERSLSVGFVGSTLYGMLPKIIRRFRDENKSVELSLHEMSTMDQIRALKDGRIDVGFGRIRHEDANIRRVTLREEKMIVALPVGHPLSAFVNVLVASPHATCFSSAGSIRSGLSQTLSAKLQFRIDPDQRSGVLAFASA